MDPMSYFYSRPKGFPKNAMICIGYTDEFEKRQQISTGIRVTHAGRIPLEAQQFKDDLDRELRYKKRGIIPLVAVNPPILSKALDEYLDFKRVDYAASTVSMVKLSVRKLIDFFGDVKILEIHTSDLFHWRTAMIERDGETNAAAWIRHVAPFFKWCASKVYHTPPYIIENPFVSELRLNPKAPLPVLYTKDELEKMFTYFNENNPKLYRQLRFLLLTGFRSEESCKLRWDQILFHQDVEVIRSVNFKGDRPRDYPLFNELKSLILSVERPEDPHNPEYVFRYRDKRALYRALVRNLTKLGINKPKAVHALKKNYVTALFERGIGLGDIQELAHHKSIQTTLAYYKEYNPTRLKEIMDEPLASQVSNKIETF